MDASMQNRCLVYSNCLCAQQMGLLGLAYHLLPRRVLNLRQSEELHQTGTFDALLTELHCHGQNFRFFKKQPCHSKILASNSKGTQEVSSKS